MAITRCQVLEVALEAGAVSLAEVVAWADREILGLPAVPSWIIELSLSNNADGAARALRSSGQIEGRLAPEHVVFLYLDAVRVDRSSPQRAIEWAFSTVVGEDAPAWLAQTVYQLEEDLDCALRLGQRPDDARLAAGLAELRAQLLVDANNVGEIAAILEDCRGAAVGAAQQ